MFNAFSFYIKYLTYDIIGIRSNVYNFIVKNCPTIERN